MEYFLFRSYSFRISKHLTFSCFISKLIVKIDRFLFCSIWSTLRSKWVVSSFIQLRSAIPISKKPTSSNQVNYWQMKRSQNSKDIFINYSAMRTCSINSLEALFSKVVLGEAEYKYRIQLQIFRVFVWKISYWVVFYAVLYNPSIKKKEKKRTCIFRLK